MAMHATSTAKQDRLKQAKAEAEREIAQYRATRESNFQKQLADVRARRMCSCSAAVQLSFPPPHPNVPTLTIRAQALSFAPLLRARPRMAGAPTLGRAVPCAR